MNKIIYLFFILLITSCTQPPMYYWEDYSKTLYKYKKDLTPEMLDKHKIELLKIIEKSEKKDVRVPPGVNAELGYILLIEGQKDQAILYFKKEKLTYPESTKFIDDLTQNINEENKDEN